MGEEEMSEAGLTRADIDRLTRKYREERDKRLRADGLGQYRAVDFGGEEYSRDPFLPEPPERGRVERDVDVLVIGGGHGGLLVCDALLKAGLQDFMVIEKAGGFGGTWYWNRYPDCRCDIESYIYMPLLEEGGTMPTEKFARSREIRANAERLGHQLGLMDRTLFHTGASDMQWDEGSARWIVRTDRGDCIRARFVSLGSGPMSRPKLPGIPGLESFKGKMFHTSRWDYSYSGGDETGNLTGLSDKRVALIGTGATGVQVMPRLAQWSGHLHVVQRTPAAVADRKNMPTDPDWWRGLGSSWWHERATNFSGISVGVMPETDMVGDNWTSLFGRYNTAEDHEGAEAAKLGLAAAELLDFKILEGIRARIDSIVTDPATAVGLKPWYNYFCKRPLFLDNYYESFNRDNVTLIDTQGRSLDAVTEGALVFDGREYPVDCIIFASGFEVAVPLDRAGAIDLKGRNGARLADQWKGGMRSVHGMLAHGFPNLFMVGGVRHAAFSWNVTYNLKLQADHLVAVVRHALDKGAKSFEVTQAAEDAWLEELERGSAVDLKFLAECTPGYLNNEGADIATGIASQGYGRGVLVYAEKLAEWRAEAMDRDLSYDV
jgi:cyclohexanone monooxygenase